MVATKKLPAQISCLRQRHFELSGYKVSQLNIGCSEMVCLCMLLLLLLHLLFLKIYLTVKPSNTSNTRNGKQRHARAKTLVISVLSSQERMKTKTMKDAPFNFTTHLPKGGLKIAIIPSRKQCQGEKRDKIFRFKRTAVGINKLYAIMKTKAVKANLPN